MTIVERAPSRKATKVIGTIHAKIILAFSVALLIINYRNRF